LASNADIGKPILPSPMKATLLEANVMTVLFSRLAA
jgi:hypothetical protein